MISKQAVVDTLSSPIAFYVVFAKVAGDVCAGVFLSQFFYWLGKQRDPNGWVYKTQSDIERETGLTRPNQETARKNLKTLGVLEEKKEGIPAKLYYRLNIERLFELIESVNNSADSSIQGCGIPAYSNDGTNQAAMTDSSKHSIYTKSTSKITTESEGQQPAPALLNSQEQLPPTTAQQPATPKITVRAAQPLTPSSAAPLSQWQPMTDMPPTQRDIVAEKLNGVADLSPRRNRPTFKSPHVKAALNAAGYVAPGAGVTPVEIYYEWFSAYQPDERLSAPQEYDLMTLAGNAGVRPAIEAYGRTGYKPRNVALIIEWTFDPSKYAQRGNSNGNTSVSGKQKQDVQIEPSAPVRPMGSIFRDPEPGEYN